MALPDKIKFNFFSIVDNPEDFNIFGINLVKLIHDKYISTQYQYLESRYQKKSRRDTRNLIRSFYQCFIEFADLLFRKQKRPYVFVGSTGKRNVIVDNKTYDIYTGRIFSVIGRDLFTFVSQLPFSKDSKYKPDHTLLGLTPLFLFFSCLSRIIHSRKIHSFSIRISRQYPELGLSSKQIQNILFNFDSSFLTYSQLLRFWKPQRVYLLCHYGKAGLIAACKKLNVPIIELQHGHIMRSHRFYYLPIFPESFRNAFGSLLPDRIGVYGEYWKNILIEGKQFLPDQVFISGYYLLVPDILDRPIKSNGKKVILITTQPNTQKEIIEYINFLRQNLDASEWKVIIKLHPSEDGKSYERFLVKDFINLETDNLYNLLNIADIHITVFSTVIYEAARYPLTNYSLYSENVKDYCDEIVRSGIALRLLPNELPKIVFNKQKNNSPFYFTEFSPDSIL